MKKVKDIMSQRVVCLSPEDTIFDAAKLFSKLKIHGAPVVENEKLVGILTVSDIIRFIYIKVSDLPTISMPGFSKVMMALLKTLALNKKFKEELKKITSVKVREIMSPNPVTVSTSASFLDVARIMDEKNIHRLPVVRRKKLVGIVTGTDLMKVLIEEEEKTSKRARLSRIKRRLKKTQSNLSRSS